MFRPGRFRVCSCISGEGAVTPPTRQHKNPAEAGATMGRALLLRSQGNYLTLFKLQVADGYILDNAEYPDALTLVPLHDLVEQSLI